MQNAPFGLRRARWRGVRGRAAGGGRRRVRRSACRAGRSWRRAGLPSPACGQICFVPFCLSDIWRKIIQKERAGKRFGQILRAGGPLGRGADAPRTGGALRAAYRRGAICSGGRRRGRGGAGHEKKGFRPFVRWSSLRGASTVARAGQPSNCYLLQTFTFSVYGQRPRARHSPNLHNNLTYL